MTSAHLLHPATAAGADALGLRDQVGDPRRCKRFDAVWLDPPPGTPLAIGLRYADGPSDALAKAFALATPHDVRGVWVDGERVKG
jgi:guanine deaminase